MPQVDFSFIFYASPTPEDAECFAVHSVGRFHTRESWECVRPDGWHVHNLVYCVDGAAFGEFDGVKSHATAGSIWIMDKTKPYHFWTDPAVGHWQARWVSFDGVWARRVWELFGLTNVSHVSCCMDAEPVMEELISLLEVSGDEAGHEAAALLWRVLAIAEKAHRGRVTHTDTTQESIRRAQTFVREHLNEPLMLIDLANAAYKSPFHFARLFKKHTGFTPLAWVRQQRICRAQELFRRGELNVSEVARAVGYPSVQHFSAVFKKNTGLSPRTFVRSLGTAAQVSIG